MQGFDSVNCVPPGFYRTPERIKEDIREISSRISEVNEMLNIRELLADFLCEDSDRAVIQRAAELSELLEFASEALSELRELNKTLDELKDELVRTISYVGW